MLILAHTGITLGAAALAAGVIGRRESAGKLHESWFVRLSRYLDIRLLVIGSLLPDIIDKPVGQVLFRETFENGRIFSHTLLFLVLISAAGFILKKSFGQRWMLTLAAGTLMHLALDEMWLVPGTLFWPFLGWVFEKADLSDYIAGIFWKIFTEPKIYISEAIGLSVLLWFALTLLIKKKVLTFIRKGDIT